MLKVSAVCVFICAIAIIETQALKRANFTKKFKFKARNPFVVESDGHLYSVVSKNETQFGWYSIDNDIESCTYDLENSVFKDVRPAILQAVVFGNNTVVVGLGIRSQVTEDGYREAFYDLIWFNLRDCKHQIFKKILVDKVPSSYPEYQPQLVVYQKTFDLFFAGNKECSPCRYNTLGKNVQLQDQLKLEDGQSFGSFHVHSVQPKTLDQFFYVYSFQNGTSVVKLLDPYYKVLRQRYINYPVNAVAVNKDIVALFGICYITSNFSYHQKVSCERLDIYLNNVHSFHLPIPEDNLVSNITISLDALGNAFVGVIQWSLTDRRHSRWLAFFRYDRYGQLRESLDFGDFGRRRAHYEADVFTKLESYLVGDQFCLVAYEEFGCYALNHRLHLRCIRLMKDDDD